jgi:hypothetical protein
MPEFTTLSVQEAMVRTIPGRQGSFLNQYIDYIQQVASGLAGKLHPVEREKPATIRRRLLSAAKALDTSVTIKRSGEDVYFWREDTEAEQTRRKRRYTRRNRRQQETAEQYFSETGELEQGDIQQTGA